MILFRPTGRRELELVAAAEWQAWPPRLPEQPIFYPVLTFAYAEKIARDWNAKGPDGEGFVTRFDISDRIAEVYKPELAGGRDHQELWVPAEDLEAFNREILGRITVEAYYRDGRRRDRSEANLPGM